jgi:hypothetical protein
MTTLAMAVGAGGASILPSAVLMSRIVEPLGWTLVHFAWQGLLVGAGSAIVLRVLHGARPQVRYALACVSLLVMIVAPLSTFAMLTAKDGDAPAAASASAATPSVVASSTTAPLASSATSTT